MDLSLNALLRAACLPIETTILLRHGDGRARGTLYRAAMAKDQRFEDYQRRQVSPNVVTSFDAATHLVGFVVDHTGDTVFAGAWHIQGKSDETFVDPFVATNPDELPASIETAGSGLGEQEVIRLEGCWKEKLGSRERGLNRN